MFRELSQNLKPSDEENYYVNTTIQWSVGEV